MEAVYYINYGFGVFVYHIYSGDITLITNSDEEHYQGKGYIRLELMEALAGISSSNIKLSSSCEKCKMLEFCDERVKSLKTNCSYVDVEATSASIRTALKSGKSALQMFVYPVHSVTTNH